MPSFESFPLWVNLAALAAGAIVVWFAGGRLERAVRAISSHTRLGSAFGGIVLLAFATSLPEVATTVSGATLGNATLVTNNLIGGIAMQTAILSIADFAFRRGALTYFTPRFPVLLGGVSLVLLLGLTIAFMAAGEPIALAGIGLGAAMLLGTHLTLVYFNYRSRGNPGWQPVREDDDENDPTPPTIRSRDAEQSGAKEEKPLLRYWLVFGACSAAILAAGWAVMLSAQAVAAQTGIAESFIGATLVAIATSLPEVSTTLAAVRSGDNEMAFANIFGSNLWCVSLLFLGDIFFRSGPLLAVASREGTFMASLGIVVTSVYLWGLLERKNRTIGRIGVDSAVVLVLYAVGLVVLYSMP